MEWLVWVLVPAGGILLVSAYSREQRIRALEKRLSHTHRLIQQVADKLGLSDPLEDELRHMVANGQKIEAIKRAQAVLGMTLREAKDFVDSL